jgi:hypothetical protein
MTVDLNKEVWGMIAYEIVGDGCLNGLWSNDDKGRGKVMNEIARKKGPDSKKWDKASDENRMNINGEYNCAWIERGEVPTIAELKISNMGSAYSFEWLVDGVEHFIGVGRQVGAKQVLVTYWDGDAIRFDK